MGNFQEVIRGSMSSGPSRLAAADSTPDTNICANFYTRMQYRRWVGFQKFITNKAYAVSDAVPPGYLWLIFALSALHAAATQRVLHLFAVPPVDALNLANAQADAASPHFLGAVNNPPLKSGVLISVGGNSNLPDMQTLSSSSVNGLISPFYLPENWKILCSIDSNEAAIAGGDGITIDAALVEVEACECIPDF
jgi:hypothetical protein